ncbi:unnamed protein product [Urochloa humidicola]
MAPRSPPSSEKGGEVIGQWCAGLLVSRRWKDQRHGSIVVVQRPRRRAARCISYRSPILLFLPGREDGNDNSEEPTVHLDLGRNAHLTELDTGIGGAYEDLHPVILMFVGTSSCGAMARPLRKSSTRNT